MSLRQSRQKLILLPIMAARRFRCRNEYISNFLDAMKDSTPYDKSDKRNNS